MMKQIGESSEVFQAYARIDFNHYVLESILKKIGVPRSPIATMVDLATGFAQHKFKQTRKELIAIMKEIIKDKELIDADCANDKKFLKQLQEMK